jgi:hypothetical protein
VGYDDPTVHCCLFLEAMLTLSFIFTCGLIYHWSRADSESAESLHGAKDAKWQVRQSKAILGSEMEDDCQS